MPDSMIIKNPKRLRIYFSESDRWRGKSLDDAILETLRQAGLAGATIFRGVAGFGAFSRIQTSSIEVLSMDLPLVVEVIDSAEKLADCLEKIKPMVQEGLITMEDVQVIKYTHRLQNLFPADRLVSEVMTKDVVVLYPTMTIYDVWRMMLEKKVKAMPVVDNAHKVIGILTDEDLLERAGINQRLSVALCMDKGEIENELAFIKTSQTKVSEVMTSPVTVIRESANLHEAISLMVKAGLKRMPVVDHEGLLVGMLSRLDILRQVAQFSGHVASSKIMPGAVRVLKDVMSKNIPLVLRDDDVAMIIEKFAQADSHRLIVVDDEMKAIGLISDGDVVMRVQASRRRSILDMLRGKSKNFQGNETAADLMSPGVLTAPPEMPVSDATKLMLSKSRKWLVVVDARGRALGLVDRQILLESAISEK